MGWARWPNFGPEKHEGEACGALLAEPMPDKAGPARATLTLPIPSGYLARPPEGPRHRSYASEKVAVSDARASGGSAPHNDPENPRWSRG